MESGVQVSEGTRDLENLVRDTRETMIAGFSDMKHIADRQAEHIQKSAEDRSKIWTKLDCIDKKFGALNDAKQQVIGASRFAKALWGAGAVIGVAGVSKLMHVAGMLGR